MKPRLTTARDELRDLAGEIDPVKEPVAFARRLRERIREVNRRG